MLAKEGSKQKEQWSLRAGFTRLQSRRAMAMEACSYLIPVFLYIAFCALKDLLSRVPGLLLCISCCCDLLGSPVLITLPPLQH